MNGTVTVSERRAHLVAALSCTGAVACAAAPPRPAADPRRLGRRGAAPTWNMAPNERDAITGTPLSPSQTVFPTVVYRRYTTGWKHAAAQRAAGPATRT